MPPYGLETSHWIYVRDKMRNFDIVHFAGHAEYNRQKSGKTVDGD